MSVAIIASVAISVPLADSVPWSGATRGAAGVFFCGWGVSGGGGREVGGAGWVEWGGVWRGVSAGGDPPPGEAVPEPQALNRPAAQAVAVVMPAALRNWRREKV